MTTGDTTPLAADDTCFTPFTDRRSDLEPPLSWTDWFMPGKNQFGNGEMALSYIEPKVIDGENVAVIREEDVAEEIERWKSALVGYIFGGKNRTSYLSVKRFVEEKWAHAGEVKVFKVENRIFLFKFQDIELSRKVLGEGQWYFGPRRPLILRPWIRRMSLTKEVILEKQIPLWVKFDGLKKHLWGTKNLEMIASQLGEPICFADTDSSRLPPFPRVCILMKAENGLPSSIPICEDGIIVQEQKLVYDWVPPICSTCKLFGHGDQNCPAAINVGPSTRGLGGDKL